MSVARALVLTVRSLILLLSIFFLGWGRQVAQAMEYEAIFNVLHCLPTTLAHETLGLHAMILHW